MRSARALIATGRIKSRHFLFPSASDRWVGILRLGLGLQVTLYAWSLRGDWKQLYAPRNQGLVSRALAEAVLSSESIFAPRLGWTITLGRFFGLTEDAALTLSWLLLFAAGSCLLLGLCCRGSAIATWFFYLGSAKSGTLFAYGVDNFTTIGLFYLMLAPLPDRWAWDRRWARPGRLDPQRLGFQRRVLQLHLCVIYFFGGLSKSLGFGWWSGDSVWRALTRPPFDLVPIDTLLHFSYFLPAIGILVCLLETAYPLGIWPKRIRPYWLGGILLMHLSIGLTMGLYLFALVMIVLNLAAFGPEFLELLEERLRARGEKSEPWRQEANSEATG